MMAAALRKRKQSLRMLVDARLGLEGRGREAAELVRFCL